MVLSFGECFPRREDGIPKSLLQYKQTLTSEVSVSVPRISMSTYSFTLHHSVSGQININCTMRGPWSMMHYAKALKVFSHDVIHIFEARMPVQTMKQIVSIATIRAATLQRRL